MVNCGRVTVGSMVVIALTGCGGESSSSASNAASDTPSSISASTFANKAFFTLDPKDGNLYHITTLKFGDASSSVRGGQGYLDGNDYLPSVIDTNWSVDGDTLILNDFGWQLTVVKQDADAIELCGSDYPGGKATSCADSVREVWYTDKSKAKSFVDSKSTGTAIDLTQATVPDDNLRLLLTNMELDYIEQLTRLYARAQNIESIKGLEQFTNIERLWLTENKITDIAALSSLAKLKRLYIEDQKKSDGSAGVSMASFVPIEDLKSITHLWMGSFDADAPTIKFDLVSFLAQLTNKDQLVELRMSNVGLTNSDVAAITGMKSLESLRIEEERSITNLSSLSSSNDWSKLKRLEVGSNGDGDTLVSFDLGSMINSGLDLSKLTYLKISQTETSDANLKTIGAGVGSNLVNLDVRNINNTSYDFGTTFSVPNLQQFRLARDGESYDLAEIGNVLTPSKLTLLYVERGTITGLAVGDYSNLTSFRPRKSNVSDMTVQKFADTLKKMSKLQSLDIRETKVAGTGVTCSQLVDLGLNSSISCRE